MSSTFRTDSPRLQIRSKDNLQGANPTVARMGRRSGVFSSSFNDVNSIIFTGSSQISWPQSLMVGSSHLSSTYLVGSGSTVKGVADGQLTFPVDTPNFTPFVEDALFALSEASFYATGSDDDRFDSKLRDKVAIKIDISTAQEARLTRAPRVLSNTDPGGFLSGTDISGMSYYNFRLKRWEMIGLTDVETGVAVPFDWRIEATGSLTNIVSGTYHFPSQFVAYHGLSPRLSGAAPDSTVSLTAAEQQEYMQRRAIGSPTVTHLAPFGNKYHATSSQTIRLRDYINQPFLVEKIVATFPIQAERRSNSATFFSSSNYTIPQEDYVFFIYRQCKDFLYGSNGFLLSRDSVRSQAEYATGSTRHLMCSGVMTFYNSYVRWPLPSTGSEHQDGIADYRPFNTPAFQHNWNVSSSSNPATANAAVFTGSVTLEMPVAVASAYMATSYNFLSSATASIRATVQHFWPGGTNSAPFGANDISGKSGWRGLYGEPKFGNPTYTYYAAEGSTAPDFTQAKQRLGIEYFDYRAVKMLGGENVASGSLTYQQSVKSPYLLMPDDELVLGLEAALSPPSLFVSGGNHTYGNANNVTGSMLRVMPGPASIVLYGSTVRNGNSYDTGHNSFLTSEAASEVIGEDYHDQFDLRTADNLLGSINDYIASGSIFSTGSDARRIFWLRILPRYLPIVAVSGSVSEVTQIIPFDLFMSNVPQMPSGVLRNGLTSKSEGRVNNTSALNTSCLRFTKLVSEKERVYDSIMPAVGRYLEQAGATHTGSYISSSAAPSVTVSDQEAGGKIYKFVGSSNTLTLSFLEKYRTNSSLFTLPPHPYAGNPTRPLQDEKIFLAYSATINVNIPYSEYVISNQDLLRMLLFTRGYYFTKVGIQEINLTGSLFFPTIRHDLSGAMQTKYGIASALPLFSEQIYRNDHYGQFRDRLEQTKFTVFYDVTETGRKGKRLGPVTVRFQDSEGNFVSGSESFLSGCSNRSTEATSSLPYVDGSYTNWSSVF